MCMFLFFTKQRGSSAAILSLLTKACPIDGHAGGDEVDPDERRSSHGGDGGLDDGFRVDDIGIVVGVGDPIPVWAGCVQARQATQEQHVYVYMYVNVNV